MRPAIYYVIAMSLVLSSCASLSTTSLCPKQSIGQCQSMSTVNDLVDQGAFDKPTNIKKNVSHPANNKQRVSNVIDTESPKRIPETILKIWLAPYEDAAGNYISDHTVFTVVQAAHWHDQPTSVATITEEALLTPSLATK